jgi:hypothetical protein
LHPDVAVLSLLLLRLGAPPSAPEGQIAISLAPGDGQGAFENGVAAPVRSVAAEIEDLDGCRILTLCISDAPGRTCAAARKRRPAEGSFVLMVGVRLGPSGSPESGRYEDIGVILRAPSTRYEAHGQMGEVIVTHLGSQIEGRLAIRNARFTATGPFSAKLDVAP